MYVKSSSINGSNGKSTWYACGEESNSTTHNSVLTLKSRGRGSYNLISTVGSIPSSVSILYY